MDVITNELIEILDKVVSGSYSPTEQERSLMSYIGTTYGNFFIGQVNAGLIRHPTEATYRETDGTMMRFACLCNYLIAPDKNPISNDLKLAVKEYKQTHSKWINKQKG